MFAKRRIENVMRKILLLFVLVQGTLTAIAQEQTIVISKPPRVEATDTAIDTDTFTATIGKSIIDKVFPTTSAGRGTLGNAGDPYYVIHALRYGDGGGQEWDGWFVYHNAWANPPKWSQLLGDPRYNQHLTDSRIFGSKNVRVVYAHINLRGFVVEKLPENLSDLQAFWNARTPKIDGKDAAANTTLNTPAMLDNLRKLLRNEGSGPLSVLSDDGKTYSCQADPLDPSGQRTICLEEQFKDATKISYEVKITQKTRQPVEDFNKLAAFVTGGGVGDSTKVMIPAVSLTAYGGGNVATRVVPSNLDIKALVESRDDEDKKTSKDLGKIKIDNEGKYHWNVSFAVPVVRLDELHYVEKTDSAPAQFQPKEVSKQRVYGVLNFYPWAIDTKNPSFRIKPGFMAGLAISEKALNHQLYAVNLGIWHLDAFWGFKVNRVELPRAEGETKTKHDISARWTFGVNLPVNTVIGLLTPKKKEE